MGNAPDILLVRVTAIAKANKHHAVTSSTAAQVKAKVPKRVPCKLFSVIIRAKTGKAVIDKAEPKNKANAVKETPLLETIGYRINAVEIPNAKGTTILT